MRARTFVVLALVATLAACGSSREQQAAAACNTEIAKRLAGKRTFELNLGDMAANAKPESADTLMLSSVAVFDKGLSTEYKQTFDCRVRFDNAGATSVLFLDFKWDNADLKKAE